MVNVCRVLDREKQKMPREWTKGAGVIPFVTLTSQVQPSRLLLGVKKGEAARANHMKHSMSVCLTIYCNLIHLAAFPEQESQGKYASS